MTDPTPSPFVPPRVASVISHDLLLIQFREALDHLSSNSFWTQTRVDRYECYFGEPPYKIAVENSYSYKRFVLQFMHAPGGKDDRTTWIRLEPVVWNADVCRVVLGENGFLSAIRAFQVSMVESHG